MNVQYDFRALLLKIQDLLSDSDRHRLHFLLGEDIPKYLRDDDSVSGALRVLETLLEKAIISHQDCVYLIEALETIQLHDAARRLQEFQKFQGQSNLRTFSLQDILRDNEEDKVYFKKFSVEYSKSGTIEKDPSTPQDIERSTNQTSSEARLLKTSELPIHDSEHTRIPFMKKWISRECILLSIAFVLFISSVLIISIVLKMIPLRELHSESIDKYESRCPITTKPFYGPHITKFSDTVAGGHGKGKNLSQLNNPHSIVVDDNETMYIIDRWNHRVVQWKRDGKVGEMVAGNGMEGNQLNQLRSPSDIVFDNKTNSLIICDNENNRVMRWSLLPGTTEGHVLLSNISCYGLAMDYQGDLYVSDVRNDEVRRYKIGSNTGLLVAGGHGRGYNSTQLNMPFYIFVDQQLTLYVSDRGNCRVMKWAQGAKTGVVVAERGVNATARCDNDTSEKPSNSLYPYGLFVDAVGNLYIADRKRDQVLFWPKDAIEGYPIVDGTYIPNGTDILELPTGIFLQGKSILYVVYAYNSVVKRYSIPYTN